MSELKKQMSTFLGRRRLEACLHVAGGLQIDDDDFTDTGLADWVRQYAENMDTEPRDRVILAAVANRLLREEDDE